MATTSKPGTSYVWVTWAAKLLAQSTGCVYSAWFRVHFRYDKIPDTTFDSAAWNADHTALVEQRADDLRAEGWTVTVEDQNKFTLRGQSSELGGKPDIVATKPGRVKIVDAKTGKKRDSDWWQVLLYIFAYVRIRKDLPPMTEVEGEIAYRDGTRVRIAIEELNGDRIAQIGDVMRKLASENRPLKRPSQRECAMCDIGSMDCLERVDIPDAASGETRDF